LVLDLERWAGAVQKGLFGVWDLDPALEVVHCSPAWKQHLGFPDPLLPDSTAFWRCRVHPEDLQPMLNALQAHLDGFNGCYEMTFRLRSNGSGYRTVLSRGRVVARDERAGPTRMVGTMADITGRPVAQVPGLPESVNVPRLLSSARTPLHALLARHSEGHGLHAGAAHDQESGLLVSEVSDLLDLAWHEATTKAAFKRRPP
jgi:hypothetical protein